MVKPYQIALQRYGLLEVAGEEDNPEIVQMFKDLGFGDMKDEVSWCSAFVNWCCKVSGLPFTGKLDARSWLKWGEVAQDPQLGDIVVFWRESKSSWKGHVGFYINERDGKINVLGGNQSNQVNISGYPKSRLLGYRRNTEDNG